MSKITHNIIPDFGNPNKSEEEKKKDTMTAWTGITSVEDLKKEDRKKFLDAISGVKKKASNPIPIDANVVQGLASDFIETFISTLMSYGLDPVAWLNTANSIPSRVYEEAFYRSFDYKHKDVSGSRVMTLVTIGINPHIPSDMSTAQIPPEIREQYYPADSIDRVNYMKVIFGGSEIRKWVQTIERAKSLNGADREALNYAIINLISHNVYTIVAHEISHAVDIVGRGDRLRDAYEDVFSINEDMPIEEQDQNAAFYYTTREELKAHINQTIYEVEDYISMHGPEALYGQNFLEFLESKSTTFHTMKYHLTVRPGDKDRRILNKTLDKRKEEAWKKYLRTLWSWWERVMARLEEHLSGDISRFGQRRLARFFRNAKINKTIIKKLI